MGGPGLAVRGQEQAVQGGQEQEERGPDHPHARGNEVAFSDKKGAESIRIATKKGNEIFISQKSGKELISITSKKDVSIEAKGQGSVTIKTGGKTIVEAKQQVLIKAGPPGLKIVSGGPLKIEGKMMNIEAKMLNIKGAMVTIEGKMVTIKGMMIKLGK